MGQFLITFNVRKSADDGNSTEVANYKFQIHPSKLTETRYSGYFNFKSDASCSASAAILFSEFHASLPITFSRKFLALICKVLAGVKLPSMDLTLHPFFGKQSSPKRFNVVTQSLHNYGQTMRIKKDNKTW